MPSQLAHVFKQDEFAWDQRDIERLIARMEPEIQVAFVRAVIIAQRENTLEQLIDLARAGRLNEIIEDVSIAGARSLADVINTVFVEAGKTVSGALASGLQTIVSFDQVNQRAVNIMQANRLRIVAEFVTEQRVATRDAIVDGIRRGLNPRAQARNFRASIGLTSRQQQAVQTFRQLLQQGSADALTRELRDRRFDPTVRRAVRGELILTDSQVDRMVNRYGERFVRFRSEVIARTEALRAVHEGTEEGFRQAIQNGVIDEGTLIRTWHTASDDRVRGSHVSMNGQERPLGEPFISGAGNELRFPGDINAPASETIQCRCSVSTRVEKVGAF